VDRGGARCGQAPHVIPRRKALGLRGTLQSGHSSQIPMSRIARSHDEPPAAVAEWVSARRAGLGRCSLNPSPYKREEPTCLGKALVTGGGEASAPSASLRFLLSFLTRQDQAAVSARPRLWCRRARVELKPLHGAVRVAPLRDAPCLPVHGVAALWNHESRPKIKPSQDTQGRRPRAGSLLVQNCRVQNAAPPRRW